MQEEEEEEVVAEEEEEEEAEEEDRLALAVDDGSGVARRHDIPEPVRGQHLRTLTRSLTRILIPHRNKLQTHSLIAITRKLIPSSPSVTLQSKST